MSYVPPHLRKATATKVTATKATVSDTKLANSSKKEEFPELKPDAKTDTKTELKTEVKAETNVKPKMDFSKLFKNAGPKPVPKKPMKRGLVLLSKTRPKDSMTEEEWKQEEEERLALRKELHFQKITLNLDKRRNQMREFDPSYESEQVITSSSEEDPEEPVEEEPLVEDEVDDELEDE